MAPDFKNRSPCVVEESSFLTEFILFWCSRFPSRKLSRKNFRPLELKAFYIGRSYILD
jgi:hypothetical protein